MRSFVVTTAVPVLAFLFCNLSVSAQQIISSAPIVESPATGEVVLSESVVGEPLVTNSASSTQASNAYVCPKCGRVHGRPAGSTRGSSVQQVSSQAPTASNSSPRGRGPVSNVLAALNAQRSRQGVRGLRYDPVLQRVAERRAQQMASMRLKSHPPGSFSPGRYEGVGWSSSFSPSGVSACYTSDPSMTYAGAAMARGSDGVYFAVVYR